MTRLARFCVVLLLLLPGACGNPPPPPVTSYVPPPPVFPTSFTCGDGNTPVQNAVCQSQPLAALDVQMAAVFRQHMGDDNIFQRDQVLASQRAWLLGLSAACGLSGGAADVTDPSAVSCLTNAYQARIAVLSSWAPPVASGGDAPARAIAHYVQYKLLDAKQPSLCADLGSAAAGALSDDGSIDPTRLAGAQEIAGTHGDAAGTNSQGQNIAVDLYRANLYGGYQIRARGVSLAGAPLLTATSLGDYVQNLPNGGGRFVGYASQTGDYGDIDVFSYAGQTLALLTDTIGYDSPAPPGEAAAAALFSIGTNGAVPACLFETYLMPPPLDMGVFAQQPSLTPFLALIDQIQGPPPDGLAASDRLDSAYSQNQLRWSMFNVPLVFVAQARQDNWTGWLRARHDQVLDALYGWSQQSPQNQAAFSKLFALLRPAAVDLDTIYVQQQGLTPADAEQATALAMMELLYQSTIYIAPQLGGGPADPAAYGRYQPRYPILANPQP